MPARVVIMKNDLYCDFGYIAHPYLRCVCVCLCVTCCMVFSKLNSSKIDHVHAVEVVIDKELQQEGNVSFMGLKTLIHYSSTLQEFTHPTKRKHTYNQQHPSHPDVPLLHPPHRTISTKSPRLVWLQIFCSRHQYK